MLKTFLGSTALAFLGFFAAMAHCAEQLPGIARQIVIDRPETGYRGALIEPRARVVVRL